MSQDTLAIDYFALQAMKDWSLSPAEWDRLSHGDQAILMSFSLVKKGI